MGSQELFIEEVEVNPGVEAGLGVEYTTPISGIEVEVLGRVKTILLVSVPIGFNGGEYQKGIVEKVRNLREIYDGTIFVDGGMNPERYRQVKEAGATEAGASSYLWEGELEERLEEFELGEKKEK
jgi:ribulose-phosphate 3-epimerase